MPSRFLPHRAAARWFAGKLANSDWPAIARDALEAGFDGRALRRLAALEKANHWDVVNFIDPALSEMGAPHMSPEEALLWSAKDICRDIAGGSRNAFDGAAEISQDILRTLLFPKELMPIFEEIEMRGTGLLAGGEAGSREQILSHARALLSSIDEPPQESWSELAPHVFENSGVQLHSITTGPKDGPVIILLHGFPEFWYGWHRQIEPLAAAGFRVIVPDQRGYNLSSKPSGVAPYALTELVSDVIAIADQLSQEKIFLAGHDWGAAVAWSAALLHPQRIAKLAILNVPHPSVMRKFLSTRPRQLLRSWYMFFFQLPWLPETLFSVFNYQIGTRSLLRSSRPGTFSPEDLAQYRAAWSQPGALTAMINWYRALFRTHVKFQDKTVRVPTRILWGERDDFLLTEMAHESLRHCTDGELFTFANASHWLQHEEHARVSELLVEFFHK
jgi:pimeloyl-ACP methyl ester carboxylesterase